MERKEFEEKTFEVFFVDKNEMSYDISTKRIYKSHPSYVENREGTKVSAAEFLCSSLLQMCSTSTSIYRWRSDS